MANKWLVTTEGDFLFGNVELHEELLKGDTKAIGGGYYHVPMFDEGKVYLYDSSSQYGGCTKEQVEESLKKKNPFNDKQVLFSKSYLMKRVLEDAELISLD